MSADVNNEYLLDSSEDLISSCERSIREQIKVRSEYLNVEQGVSLTPVSIVLQCLMFACFDCASAPIRTQASILPCWWVCDLNQKGTGFSFFCLVTPQGDTSAIYSLVLLSHLSHNPPCQDSG